MNTRFISWGIWFILILLGLDIILVLAACADRSPRTEHQDSEFGLFHSVYDTRELFGLVLAVQLDGYVWKVEFLRHSGGGDHIDDSESLFVA